jgi:hypothetical protein
MRMKDIGMCGHGIEMYHSRIVHLKDGIEMSTSITQMEIINGIFHLIIVHLVRENKKIRLQ